MKAENAGIAAVIGIWLVYVVISMSLFAGVIWAAIHFIKKFW